MPPHHAVMDNSIYPPLAKIHKICTTYSIWSYGKQRGLVSPVGAQEATAYADALNYMLATPGWHAPIGRAASVVCWSDDADPRYPDALLHQAGLRQTPPPDDADGLDESMPCHVMALSSAKGRAIVLMHEDASYGRMRSRLHRTASDMTGDEDGPAPDMGRILDSPGDSDPGPVLRRHFLACHGPYHKDIWRAYRTPIPWVKGRVCVRTGCQNREKAY
ncbi:hypothetical protein DKK68_00640 [Bifidobacterium asteroides]|uniref:type I-C CRISPR-associated protein Cas8c/Csd1 n=1 Tax=Bifidobacterium asteroides TaxID=1684 RepID=UPI000D785BA9|nr:type I-C CRISPR-associated protein Cas8c/Csd1 [Bifidobacterium asteroides]PXY88718.1 hypothetical protein DKK68_00640 [Bifidobacterium asteroides]